MQNRTIEKYFFLGFLLIVTLFSLLIFRPFLPVIIVGASLSVVLHPLYNWFKAKVTRGKSWIAALLTVIIFIVILFGPVLAVGILVFNQSQDLYHSFVAGGSSNAFLESINQSVNKILPDGTYFQVQDKFADLVTLIYNNIANIFTTTLQTFLSLILVILTIFFFLKDGDEWKNSLIKISPLSDKDDEKILTRLSNSINGIIKGYLFIAIAQGALMGVGLAIFGVPSPALWGVFSGFASLVPTIGTGLVAVPAVLFLFATGSTGAAIGMAIWAIVIVGLMDNFLNPLIVGQRIEVPPLLILFAVLGGIALMGPVGILIGPLTISLLYALIGIYRHSFQSTNS
jgi:predicted PurR-regulated permease PerM